MRWLFFVILMAVAGAGCARSKSQTSDQPAVPGETQAGAKPNDGKKPAKEKKPSKKREPKKTEKPAPVPDKPVVTPDDSLRGQVLTVNFTARFVVIYFNNGKVPIVGRKLFLYRQNLKVAEIRVTGPQQDNSTVADILTGTAQSGDEVREQ